ncbi:MAG TPA: hypothetical protein VHA82_10315 [Ramlibacter sp.]|nr:hypothetical protein [Ramlibacter sp.]
MFPAKEAGPILDADDPLGHQTAQRAARPAFADVEGGGIFTERFWYMGTNAPAGDIVFGAGLGYYPNRGVMDGYAGVTIEGVQYAFRGSRRLGAAPFETRIGPMTIDVVRSMRWHRIELAANDSALAMHLEYTAAFEPNDEGLDTLEKEGRLVSQVSRFVQMGHFTGWIEVNGRRHEFGSGNPLWGARDRSWGLRLESRTDESHPPVTRFRPLLFMWACAQFEQSAIHFFLKESAPGVVRFVVGDETFAVGSGTASRKVSRVEHDIEWSADPYSQFIAGGRFVLHFEDGTQKTMRMRALPGKFFLKAGLYGGYRGWFQGDDKGPLHMSQVRWDLADPETRRELRTLAEQPMEFDVDGRLGFGTIQGGVAAGYSKYHEVQHLPVM